MFPVAWAGEERSANWFDVGREYTERFSKRLGPAEARERVTVEGDQALGAGVLGALAIMA
jgi:hypothetical protein